jgi:hypothetical protein
MSEELTEQEKEIFWDKTHKVYELLDELVLFLKAHKEYRDNGAIDKIDQDYAFWIQGYFGGH